MAAKAIKKEFTLRRKCDLTEDNIKSLAIETDKMADDYKKEHPNLQEYQRTRKNIANSNGMLSCSMSCRFLKKDNS